MAKPAKRKVQGGRVTPKGTRPGDSQGAATQAPSQVKIKGPSPQWVPILMFGLLAAGIIVIFLNYVGLMPGGEADNWYLLLGLGLILAGIITATQYR